MKIQELLNNNQAFSSYEAVADLCERMQATLDYCKEKAEESLTKSLPCKIGDKVKITTDEGGMVEGIFCGLEIDEGLLFPLIKSSMDGRIYKEDLLMNAEQMSIEKIEGAKGNEVRE